VSAAAAETAVETLGAIAVAIMVYSYIKRK